jgi:hypothetical protein
MKNHPEKPPEQAAFPRETNIIIYFSTQSISRSSLGAKIHIRYVPFATSPM